MKSRAKSASRKRQATHTSDKSESESSEESWEAGSSSSDVSWHVASSESSGHERTSEQSDSTSQSSDPTRPSSRIGAPLDKKAFKTWEEFNQFLTEYQMKTFQVCKFP